MSSARKGRDLGLRVFLGQRAAMVSSSTVDPASFTELAERAVAMARVVPEDPYAGLADTAAPPEQLPLDLVDPTEPTTEQLVARAAAAEAAALAVPGITNSEGAEAGFSRTEAFLVTSAGFAGSTARTSHSVSATALAGSGTAMQRDYDYHSTVYLADLDDPAAIGRSAGERAIARLNPTRPATARMPVVYDPRVAGGLLGHLAGAINGASVARGTSFLKDRMGQRRVRRRDRGARRSAPGARPALPRVRWRGHADRCARPDRRWRADDLAAGQPLGPPAWPALHRNAARGTGGPPSPSPSNLYLAAGRLTPAELMADIKLGLYVTELIGMGVNGVTGDYSRGAAGFMIRDGALAEPVAEITIAGNLLEMFAHLTPANDLPLPPRHRCADGPGGRDDNGWRLSAKITILHVSTKRRDKRHASYIHFACRRRRAELGARAWVR